MRGLYTLILIFIILFQNPALAFFQKKDYKQIFLNNATSAEKRQDDNSAFHSYEKALYYYKKDKKVIESYAKFCERRNYLEKSSELYNKLYVLTKDAQYKFRSDIVLIKNGKLTDAQIQKIITDKKLNSAQKNEINKSLIFHYAYKKKWTEVKNICDKFAPKNIGADFIVICADSAEKTGDVKALLKYRIRKQELASPNDSEIIKKVINSAEKLGDIKTQETFVKKLSVLNPKDNGIKYKLAGIYEKQKKWKDSAQIYKDLMASGDKSDHVKNSYAYVLSELNPSKKQTPKSEKPYIPEPLSKFKRAEKSFYQSWKNKEYNTAQKYLAEMIKEQPKNKKLLKHKVDIDVSQNNYDQAIIDFEKLNTQSVKDSQFLAFLYSKTENYKKALEIIEATLQKNQKNKDLLELALQYSLTDENWDSAIFYNSKLLAFEPKSEILLKNGGDLYSLKQDFLNAAEYYKKLVKYYPKLEYQQELANLHMANKDFESAEKTLEPLYNKYPDNKKITQTFLNSLLAQDKVQEAYKVVKEKNLENTKEGYIVLGDLALKYKHYDMAQHYYFKAMGFEPKNTIIRNKLADSYRLDGQNSGAAALYKKVLKEDPDNLEARLGIGSLEIGNKNFLQARNIFRKILKDKPDYKPARIAIAHAYNANNEKLSALSELDKLPDSEETKFMRAQIFYDINMRSDSSQELMNIKSKDAADLQYKIKKDKAITIIPTYTGYYQTLANEFRLNYQKYGVQVSQEVDKNTNVFAEYNVYWYTSGADNFLSNVTNEFKGGLQSKPNEKFEYRAELGVKAFQGQGGMLTTNSWLKYNFNDWFNLKLGFYRNNVEQSYTSAVGQYINGIYTGQVAENRVFLEYDAKLPLQFYTFGRGSYGLMTAQNMPTNQFFEAYIGVGKAFYNNPKNPWVNTVAFDVVTYNSAYQYDLLKLYNTAGQLFGGYFSPSYFNATTGNLKIEGSIKKLRMRYGVKAFGGIQISRTPNFQMPTWGYNPYIAFDINEHVTLNGSYQHFTYADMERDIFMFNLVIKGFKRNVKS